MNGDFGIRDYSLVTNLPTETWTTGEIAALLRLAPMGAQAVAVETHRTVYAVQCQARRLGVSLRIRVERIDSESATLDEAWYLLHDQAPLCPRCSRNPADSTGFCRPCRLRRIAEARAYAQDCKEAQRESDVHRQRRHRDSKRSMDA